jgi:hypothetical protein
MSLLKFLKNKDVKERFHQEFPMAPKVEKKEILAPPISNRYSLVGTAFDYLLRFYLKYLNPDAITFQWVAEAALLSPLLGDAFFNADTGKVVFLKETELTKKARSLIAQAKADYSLYLSSGQITDQLIESCLHLAQLDPIFRRRAIDMQMGIVFSEDVDDLRKLISLVDPSVFKASHLCLLDPTFGEGSRLVRGADVDLVLDETIIDIKTTKYLQVKRQYFYQLIGYYVLYYIDGFSKLTTKPEISQLSIYFSRYAYLYSVNLPEIIHQDTFPAFVEWFIKRAKQEYPGNYAGFIVRSV